ncbi:MAG: Gfo/Idh/MocA family oxidoreductase, partial [Ferrovibrio sp.]
MADHKLRVALIGCGLISLYHLRAWKSAGVEIVAVCDTDHGKAEARAREFDVSRIYTNAADMFAQGGFD